MSEIYDVIVVGGGVNGTGIARDCALRGFKTLLLEKKDLASGATGACSGMIHGGLRYLLYDIETTRHSCLDSGYIQRIAPHMLFRIPFIMPISPSITAPFYETYFEKGGLYIQLNVIDRDTLIDAKKHPEKHRELLVRVTGYSAYFVSLSPESQDSIIARYAHAG